MAFFRHKRTLQVEANRFGDYNVTKLLHDGEKAFVYHARHQGNGHAAAVKAYKFDHHRAVEGLMKKYGIPHEGEVGKRLNPPEGTNPADHPLVVTHDYGREFGRFDGKLFIVLEYIDGVNLKNMIGCAHPDLKHRRTAILLKTCDALHLIHSIGFIHRDFCADNVIVRPDGGVKVIDLGFAAPCGMRFEERSGTPTYMSPEQINAEELGPASDIYSFGVVAYELYTHQPPFVSSVAGEAIENLVRRRAELMQMHLRQPPAPPHEIAPKINRGIEEVIMKCLAKDPSERFRTILEVKNAIIRAKGGG